jgi:hypothetical protein
MIVTLGDPEMTELPVPLPPGWESVVGWTGGDAARWLLGFWTSLGDHPYLSDGRSSMSGTAYGWLAWSRHAAVEPHLAHFDLGNSEMEGPHALVFDRVERQVYACGRAEAQAVVRGQWPAQEPLRLSQEHIDAIVENVRRAMASRPLPTPDELMRRMREHSAQVAAMVAWLDQWAAAEKGKA